MSSRTRMVLAALALAALTASAARAACRDDFAGTCWVVTGGTARGSSAATSYGRSVRCSARCRLAAGAEILLRDDGTYSLPPSTTPYACRRDVGVGAPDEHGPIVQRRGTLILEPADLAPLDAFLDACAGRNVVIRRYRTTLRIAADGASLSGVTKVRMVAPGAVPVVSRAVQRFTATRASASRSHAAGRARDLPACSPDLKPRCVTD